MNGDNFIDSIKLWIDECNEREGGIRIKGSGKGRGEYLSFIYFFKPNIVIIIYFTNNTKMKS